MKFIAIFALAATTSAVKIEGPVAPFGLLPECEYHLSEDGLTCEKIKAECNDTTAVPILEKCAKRANASSRTDEAPATSGGSSSPA